MEEIIRKDILNILEQSIKAVKKDDSFELDDWSNHTIHDAFIYQEKNSIQIAIIIYSLAKIIKRSEGKIDEWDAKKHEILREMQRAKTYLENNDEKNYAHVAEKLIKQIGNIDGKLRLYIEDVLDKAKIVKGSKLYEHGISIGKASDLLGISQWELMSYVGKTQIIDNEEKVSTRARMNFAKKVFGI